VIRHEPVTTRCTTLLLVFDDGTERLEMEA
jgi:hypothetical protein